MKWPHSIPCLTGKIILPAIMKTHLLYREPIGEHFVQVCTTTPCMLRGSTEILNTVCEHLGGIKPGQTTKDGKFTVIEVECQGACSNAPMLVVGDDFYVSLSFLSVPPQISQKLLKEDLTPQTTKKVLDAFKNGQKPKAGPQSGRQTSENSAGLTSLTGKVCSVVSERITLESKCLAHSPMVLVNSVSLNFNRSRHRVRSQ